MNHLFREKAPITEAGWAEIDGEATRTLQTYLAGRKVMELSGPKGWQHSAEPTGRVTDLGTLQAGAVRARSRRVQPMIELRAPFAVSRAELDAFDMGACDADLDPVMDAARSIALAEDVALFHGYPDGQIVGLAEASPHAPVAISTDYDRYPKFVAQAMARLTESGVEGPYAIALGPRCYTGVIEESEMGGYPVLEHLRLILGGPVVRAPGVDGAIVLSMRGGDFELIIGQDLSIGYLSHDDAEVQLYLEESLTLRVCSPEAAIHLAYPD